MQGKKHYINDEERILHRMTYYYGDKQKAIEWYNKKNQYFSITKWYTEHKASPKEVVDDGRSQEVLKWISVTIGL